MKYKIYAIINSKNVVFEFISSYYIPTPPFDYIVIGESEAPDAYKQYSAADENGVLKYKAVDGALVERTEEEKEPERKAKEEARAKKFVPTFQASMNAFLQYLIKKEAANFDVDMKLKTAGAYEEWELGSYDVGDIRNHVGQTWECWTAHDNAIYPDITPDNPQTWANFWRPLHGKTAATARPWTKPWAGTTDMYHAGEYMIYTDGKTYKCLRDTVYSPEEYAPDWEAV